MPHRIRQAAAIVFLLMLLPAVQTGAQQVLLSHPTHLGVGGEPEWDLFRGRVPSGESLKLQFGAARNDTEQVLVIRQDDVKQDWVVQLNGRRLGTLFLMEEELVHLLPVPAGTLRDGENELQIATRSPGDILLHEIHLLPMSREKFLSQSRLQVTVRDAGGGSIPARITVVDEGGFLAPLGAEPGAKLAVRPGVIYTGDGRASVGLPPGKYTVYGSRGPEYSLASGEVGVAEGAAGNIEITLTREVDTKGWVAADTHIHTLTLSRHGDATIQERMLTLAGEGVEVAVCTEHNLHASYGQAAQALGVAQHFTSLAGNEVTTRRGHFNIFPVETTAPPPDATVEHWPDLMRGIRRSPGVQVVVLNHPHDVHSGFTPMAEANLHPVTGKNRRGFPFTFDAMEIVNSGAMRSDWMEPVRTWFALLNRGLRITGVGASDSHDVSRFIVGQGRTYVAANDADPGAVDPDEFCRSVLGGRAVISLGLFPELRVGSAGPGELVRAEPRTQAKARVQSPDWIRAGKVVFYANGIPLHEAAPDQTGHATWPLHEREQDYHLVMIASGPGVTAPHWAMARPYQPSSPDWTPVALGITNPIWIDADGDGRFTSPRQYAERLVQEQSSLDDLLRALAPYDPPVASHVAELLEEQGQDLRSAEIQSALSAAAPAVREGFELYLGATPR